MSDQLQDALDLYDKIRHSGIKATFPPDVIVEAARKVANPDLEAAQLVKIGDPCDMDGKRDQANEWVTARDIRAIVDAALGIDSEDTLLTDYEKATAYASGRFTPEELDSEDTPDDGLTSPLHDIAEDYSEDKNLTYEEALNVAQSPKESIALALGLLSRIADALEAGIDSEGTE